MEKNRGSLDKKRELGLLIPNRWSNNIQLLTNGGASQVVRFYYYLSFFYQKPKSINLAFLLNN